MEPFYQDRVHDEYQGSPPRAVGPLPHGCYVVCASFMGITTLMGVAQTLEGVQVLCAPCREGTQISIVWKQFIEGQIGI